GDQGLLLGRTAFTLEIAARDLAGGEGLFLVVDGQREEIQARLGRVAVDDGGEDHGLAVGGQDGAVGLTGDAARFQRQRAAGPIDRLAFDIEHVSSFVYRGRIPRGVPSMGGASGVQSFGPRASAPSRNAREWLRTGFSPRVLRRSIPRRTGGSGCGTRRGR